jgi:hypothetical protein
MPVEPEASLPRWWRWGAVLWLALFIPVYASTYGWRNFLALCDVAVLLGCVGLVVSSRLLVGSQALPAVVVSGLWLADIGGRLLLGKHPLGGTEYMWDPRYPLAIRLLSLFHLVLPVVLVAAVRRLGYDRRALPLQAAITLVLVAAGRLLPATKNLNYAFREPICHASFGPPLVHIPLVTIGIVILIYLPTHLLLRRFAVTADRSRPSSRS